MSRDIGRCLQELLGCVYLPKDVIFLWIFNKVIEFMEPAMGEQDIARSELVVLEDLRMFITTWDDTK